MAGRRPGTTLAFACVVLSAACASGAPAAEPFVPTTAAPATTAPATSSSTTSSMPPRPPAALAAVPYDNTAAARACTLLAPAEIQAQFNAPVERGVPIDPYCWWGVGENGFAALTIAESTPLSTFRAIPGLDVGGVPDLGDGAFVASNKTLFVGYHGATYILQFERGAEWVDANRPRLVALARLVLDRLGWVAPPRPPADPAADPATTRGATTTTTRPKPPAVPAPEPIPRPTGILDLARPLSLQQPLRIWVGGDSIAAGPAWAVGEAALATGLAVADTEFQVGTGLSRPDFFDWYRHLAAVADARDPEVMVLLFGGNDIQPLTLPGGGSVAYGDPRWLDEYRRRVAQVMDVLAVRGRHVVWVGTPPMQDAAYNAQMAALNDIYAGEAAMRAPWVSYVDAWTRFGAPGQPGAFTRDLPDANGTPQPVRIDDIHYNEHGSQLLAAVIFEHLRTFTTLAPG